MRTEWVAPYIQKIGTKVHLPGIISGSYNLNVALEFALSNISPDYLPVVFMFLMQNYKGPRGMMMNSEAYSSFPEEGEMLLMEGVAVTILGYKENVLIENTHERM